VRPIVAAAAAALALACAGCGSSGRPTTTEATPSVAKRLLAERLRARYLSFRWIACVRTGNRFEDVAVVRCNVNFGDPHIEAYCAVLRTGRLVTDHEDRAIPCKHDEAGSPPTIVHS
jgi:hypothetical protein